MSGAWHIGLILQLEEYIPFMLDEEIFYIIFTGSLPSAECVSRWEVLRVRRESELERRFSEARASQDKKLAKNSRGRMGQDKKATY